MKIINFKTNQSKNNFYKNLDILYENKNNSSMFGTKLIKINGNYYIQYYSGKNSYLWSIFYNENYNKIELTHVWSKSDYVMWIPLLFLDIFLIFFLF